MNDVCYRGLFLLVGASVMVACAKRDVPDYASPVGISWSSVLSNAIDITTVADPVQEWERSLHFSSAATTGKVLLANLAPGITGDMDHGFFLNVVKHAGGTDGTLAEIRGRGMISWVFSANPVGIIRLFIDDEFTPILEMPFKDFVEGGFLPAGYPFASLTAGGYNLHFPILHESYCKVDIRVPQKKDLASLYYQIAWNAIDPTQEVTRFSRDSISQGQSLMRNMAASLKSPSGNRGSNGNGEVGIRAGQLTDLYSSSTKGTITNIELSADRREKLSALQFLAYWDDNEQPSVDCPLYMLAGTSERMETVHSLAVHVEGKRVSIRWPMPHRRARLAVRNRSAQAIQLRYNVETAAQTCSMRFTGSYGSHTNLSTIQQNVLTLAGPTGRGRIVACNIDVKSRTDKWWGEGDQLIYLDSGDSPTWRSTGTEDYFGFAWCSQKTFDHIFRGQSAVFATTSGRASAMHRYHLLDRLPFHRFARFDTEAWGLSEGSMDYESLILYYLETEAQQSNGAYR